MEPELRKQYDLLEFKPREPIPYIGNMRIDDLYVLPYKAWDMKIKDIANERRFPESVVSQAIEWCTENDDLITKVLAKERKEAGFKD